MNRVWATDGHVGVLKLERMDPAWRHGHKSMEAGGGILCFECKTPLISIGWKMAILAWKVVESLGYSALADEVVYWGKPEVL